MWIIPAHAPLLPYLLTRWVSVERVSEAKHGRWEKRRTGQHTIGMVGLPPVISYAFCPGGRGGGEGKSTRNAVSQSVSREAVVVVSASSMLHRHLYSFAHHTCLCCGQTDHLSVLAVRLEFCLSAWAARLCNAYEKHTPHVSFSCLSVCLEAIH